jgi:hypothetical protein
MKHKRALGMGHGDIIEQERMFWQGDGCEEGINNGRQVISSTASYLDTAEVIKLLAHIA